MLKSFPHKRFLNGIMLKNSFRSRLIVYFILSVLIPTSLLAIATFTKSSKIITTKMDQLLEKNLTTAEVSILQKIESADDIATLISFNSDLQKIFSSVKPSGATNIVGEINQLNNILESYYLSNLSNFTQTTFFPRIYMLNRAEYKGYNITDKVFDISEIEGHDWYKEFNTGVSKVIGFDKAHTMLDTIDSIKIARRLYNIMENTAVYSALLTIDIEASYFTNILERIKVSPNSTVFILDEKETVILNTSNYRDHKSILNNKITYLDNGYSSWFSEVEGVNQLVSINSIEKLNWKIVSVSPVRELDKELRSFNSFQHLIISVCLVISLIMALLLANDISKPITKLVKSMSEVKGGNFDIKISYKRNDEFAFLIKRYEQMMIEIKDLIDKLYVSELAKKHVELKAREYELKALQSQINPHFLYNTLDSVNWLAIEYKAHDISTMVTSLSNFFRYSLSKGKTEISLGTEKMQIESYLKIQSIRFKEKLSYSIDFSEEILNCKTVKLILQPIVENSILHGLEKIKTGGYIEIKGYRVENHIEIMISDNGVGADVDNLNNMLMNHSDQYTSFGIINVNDRIKQFFGDEYGIRYINNEPRGVIAIITLPYVPYEK